VQRFGYSNLIRIFIAMAAIAHNKYLTGFTWHFVPGVKNSYICSFTEFFPFCPELYYFSTFKDFNTVAQACN
jgi:hypothetical protein